MDDDQPITSDTKQTLQFRNYEPGTGSSKARRLDRGLPPSVAASAQVSEAVAVAGAPRNPDAPIIIVQKKIDWDLKRDIAPQLKTLERRTRIAIREVLKQQLQG